MKPILTANWNVDQSHTLAVSRERGGFKMLIKAMSMDGQTIIDEVKASNLRGRGGAGFPTGLKWSFLPKKSDVPKYLVINADEGEPGTFKDRFILELDPHMLLEGCLITAFALNLATTYIFIRGEMKLAAERTNAAIDELYSVGLLGKNILNSGKNHDIYVHRGAGAYICGEETALIEALEGKAGQPRLKPPFPAIVGAFGCPTVVNNVETIACIPTIIDIGGDAFAEMGSERNGGPKLLQLSGKVKNPGVYEAPCGLSLREFIYSEEFGGGVVGNRELKAVIPGGSSTPVLLPDELDVGMDFDQLQKAGSMFGTGGVSVIDEGTCMVRLAARLSHFYHHESCGQCTPCREGTGWAKKILDAIEAGKGHKEDVDLLLDVCSNIEGNTICPLGEALSMPVRAIVQKFKKEFYEHIEKGKCPHPAW